VLLKTPGSLVTRSFGWRLKKGQSVAQFFRIFWPLWLVPLLVLAGIDRNRSVFPDPVKRLPDQAI
jgi:hypothetical protein